MTERLKKYKTDNGKFRITLFKHFLEMEKNEKAENFPQETWEREKRLRNLTE